MEDGRVGADGLAGSPKATCSQDVRHCSVSLGVGSWTWGISFHLPSAGQELEIPRSELSGSTRAGVLLAKGEAGICSFNRKRDGGLKLRRTFPSMENFS